MLYLTSFAAVSPDEWTVVSQESSKPRSKDEIKLPDICGQFGVECIKLVDMFKDMHETF